MSRKRKAICADKFNMDHLTKDDEHNSMDDVWRRLEQERQKPLTDRQKAISALHAEGMHDREISEETGYCTRSVYMARKELSLPVHHTRPGAAALTDEIIKADWLEPLTAKEAAGKRGCSVQCIEQRRAKLDLPRSDTLQAWAMRCGIKAAKALGDQQALGALFGSLSDDGPDDPDEERSFIETVDQVR